VEVEESTGRIRKLNSFSIVYYESRKRELNIRLMNEGRCDERLKTRVEESTCLTCTGFSLFIIIKARTKEKTDILVSVR
jgi:hypothetical protein